MGKVANYTESLRISQSALDARIPRLTLPGRNKTALKRGPSKNCPAQCTVSRDLGSGKGGAFPIRGLSQKELAAIVQVDPGMLSRWELGKRILSSAGQALPGHVLGGRP